MYLALFHQQTHRVFHGKRDAKSLYEHMFGGAVDYAGLEAFTGQPAVHLLLRLNTDDAAVGVKLPGTSWLPLLCAIRYGACDLGYRVISDGDVKILHQTEKEAWPDFPYENYPEKLAPKPVAITEGLYDPNNVVDGLFYAGVFGYSALTTAQYTKVVEHANAKRYHEFLGWESAEAFVEEGNGLPFEQGPPVDDCPDPNCSNHGRKSSLRTFAIFQEEQSESRTLWGRNCDNLQIIYQVCPACAAIRTTNQCS